MDNLKMLKEASERNLRDQLTSAYNKAISAKIANKIALTRIGMSEDEAQRFVDELDEEIFIEITRQYSVAEKMFKAMMEES